MGLERITDLRKQVGMTIDELSIRSGIPVSTLKKISAGLTANPTLDTVKAIARALGRSVSSWVLLSLSSFASLNVIHHFVQKNFISLRVIEIQNLA